MMRQNTYRRYLRLYRSSARFAVAHKLSGSCLHDSAPQQASRLHKQLRHKRNGLEVKSVPQV